MVALVRVHVSQDVLVPLSHMYSVHQSHSVLAVFSSAICGHDHEGVKYALHRVNRKHLIEIIL